MYEHIDRLREVLINSIKTEISISGTTGLARLFEEIHTRVLYTILIRRTRKEITERIFNNVVARDFVVNLSMRVAILSSNYNAKLEVKESMHTQDVNRVMQYVNNPSKNEVDFLKESMTIVVDVIKKQTNPTLPKDHNGDFNPVELTKFYDTINSTYVSTGEIIDSWYFIIILFAIFISDVSKLIMELPEDEQKS
jgi:hypothetical protein